MPRETGKRAVELRMIFASILHRTAMLVDHRNDAVDIGKLSSSDRSNCWAISRERICRAIDGRMTAM